MNKETNYLIVIPARGGSVGVPNKNLMKVHDIPLILRTFEHANYLSNNQIPICVSTDSRKILEILCEHLDLSFESLELKADTVMQVKNFFIHFRSSKKASSETIISENLFDIYDLFKSNYFTTDGIILLQPTSPFRSREELRTMREFILKSASKKMSLVSVTKVEDIHPARMYVPTKTNKLRTLKRFQKDYYSRRQDLPTIFIRDGAFYIIGSNLVKKSLQYSRSPLATVRDFPWCINIDNPVDLDVARKVPQDLVQDDASSKL